MQTLIRTTVLLSVGYLTALAGEATTRWSWQEAHSIVLPTGNLEWAPQPFGFKAGESIRYIDFESGSDANDGLSKEKPWKHHPWDGKATDQAKSCRGPHTYVFKQGVVYRGELEAHESGSPATPIALTRDPSWGAGPAVLCGSEMVTGWKRGADNKLIPEPEKVWHVDLDWAPRNVWMVGHDGAVSRITLARTPNWNITNPDNIKSEWWTWKNPDKPFDNYTTVNGQRRHLAFDKEHISTNQPQDFYEGAMVWTTKGWVMGSPFQAKVLAADREKGSLAFACQWGGEPGYKIVRGCQYYLEDKPHYLDSPGEFWFDKKGNGGRLYLRLPGDQDPNTVRVEVAKRIRMIDSRGMSHVRISGLTFRFPNIYWNLIAAPYWVSHESIDVEPGCVRLLGSGTNILVTHCNFEHVHKGVRFRAVGPQDAIDQVVVEDNVFSDADSGGVELGDGTVWSQVDGPMGRLYDVRVMRNKFDHIGIRPDLFGQGGALVVQYAQTAEVAGNMFDRVCAQGIDVHGAKQSRATTDRPFTRLLIHHNKAVDTLLNNDDFGGIETWQGGPAYVYANISGNPGGYRNWDHVLSPDTEDRFGHAYYLDGAFKNYYFNNIAWGKSKGPTGKLANTAAFQEIISYENAFFNNTLFNFVRGSRRQAPQAGRVKFLGNIWQSMGLSVFRDADPARTAAAGHEADAGPRRNLFAIDTDAYARNVFYDVGTGEGFAVFEASGRWHKSLPAFQQALASYQPLAADVGVMAEQPPLRDAAAHDFRPSANSAARGRGAKVFVPWSLYETVGEWHFYPIPGDPTRILDEHWCLSSYYIVRDDYYQRPTYPLQGVNVTLRDYQNGPLENWTTGALHFNGHDQYAILKNEDIDRAVTLTGGRRSDSQNRTVSGADLSNPQIHSSSFLIEAYFKTAAGLTDAVLIQKINGAGYVLGVNKAGGVTLATTSGGATVWLDSRGAVNDGQWHHIVAEADRKKGSFTLYLDGQKDANGPGIGVDASLANDADLFVGGAPNGHYLNGAIDFLRIARGTLADSRTTIEELYAWEFNGPFLDDFTGHRRPKDGGCAGAIDEVAGGSPGMAPAVPAGNLGAGVAPVTRVILRNPRSQPVSHTPITFGQVFKKGDLKHGVRVDAGSALGQVDIKRRYDDGSVRFAVISLLSPEIAAGGEATVELGDGLAESRNRVVHVEPADLLRTDFEVTVTLTFPDGQQRSARARQLLEQAGDKARLWLAGPVASEWLLEGPLLDPSGQPDPDLRIQFQVRAYRGCKSARVSVVLENCLDTWAGNIGYDVAVAVGKNRKVVFERNAVDHRRLSRWRKAFWWGESPGEVAVVHDLPYVLATGALPNYDRSIQVPEKTLSRLAADWAASKETDLMGSGSLTQYMPTTGGRPEIGPYPAWTVQYLLSMDPRAQQVVLGNGDLAGSWPIHVRNSKTGRIMTLDERPQFWLDDRGQDKPTWQPDRKPPPSGQDPKAKFYVLTPDVAHVGSFAYVPYLVTGDFYYLEEACFWANYCLLSQWSVPRQNARGLMSDQVRGNAWGLRNIGDAASIVPEGDPEAKYFAEKLHNNLADMTARMYGPPEYNRMGFWHPRDVQDARIQNPANPRWMLMVWWEHDYLIWTLHHLCELGYTDAAKPRDFLLRWRVGSFTNPAEFDPRLSAPYRIVIGEMGPNKKVSFYESWKQLAEENLKFGLKPELPTYGGSYSYSARMAVGCGVDAGFPKAQEALNWLNANLPRMTEALTADPVFALAPR